MSLNKFTDVQKGIDLDLKIGCNQLLSTNANIDTLDCLTGIINFASLNTVNATTLSMSNSIQTPILTATTINATEVYLDGEPLTANVGENIQTVGLATVDATNTTSEVYLNPVPFAGSPESEYKANSLKIGDVVSIKAWLKVSSTPGSTVNLKLYAGDGDTLVIAETEPINILGTLSVLDHGKLEINISIRNTNICHISGSFSVYDDIAKSSKVFNIIQKQTLLNITQSNKLKLKAQWSVANVDNIISLRQYTLSKNSVIV